MTVVALMASAGALSGAEATAPAAPAGGQAQHERLWVEEVALLGTGKIDQAFRLVDQAVLQGSTDANVKRVHRWLGDYEEVREGRDRRRQADYAKYMGWVREDVEKERWEDSIRSCALAYNTVADQDAFRQDAWVLKSVEGVVRAAREKESQEKWFDAARMYARLSEVFPHNKEYEDALKHCQAHIKLELTYPTASDKDDEATVESEWDSEWKAIVENIDAGMAREAFRRVNNDYIKEVSFKDLTVSALKHVLLLVQKKKLSKTFPNLANSMDVEVFVNRVKVRLGYAEASDGLTVDDLITYFNRVLKINAETNLLPENVLIYEFVQGAFQPLDRFTDMIWPSDVQEFNKHTQGRFSGVGIQIHKELGEPIKVISPLEDTPAYTAGIQPGDLITRINGEPSQKLSITAAVRKITGPPGTKVTLTIKRIGVEEEFPVELTREEITIFTIKGYERDEEGRWKYMIDPDCGIGYVRMSNFTEGTIDELKSVVERLLSKEKMRGLIFDLRSNPGGPLKSAVEVADLFLDGEKPIVSTRDRSGKNWSMSSTSDTHLTDFPMVVVVNDVSASASEIVVGALQDHHRALVVGERTFGKGSVQQVLRLTDSDQAYLKLTTARYYLPNGRCLHRDDDSTTWGVDPDVEVKLVPKEIIKVSELRAKKDILKGVNQSHLTEAELEQVISRGNATSKPAAESQGKADTSGGGSLKGHRDETKDEGQIKAAEDEKKDGENQDEEEDEVVREDPNDWPETDPQLDTALMLMRVRLVSGYPWPQRPAEVAATSVKAPGS